MATYKEIKGVTVQTRDEDPSLFIGTWSSGGNMNTARFRIAGAGTQTSGLAITGQYPDASDLVEEYNGSSWTEIAETNTARTLAGGAGVNAEAALVFGGQNPGTEGLADTESWNGSSWTEVNNLNQGRQALGATGSYTAALAFGGDTGPPYPAGNKALTELWDGTNWTEVNDLNTASSYVTGAGTSTSALRIGSASGSSDQVESWNGSSWTEVAELNTARYAGGASGASNTDVIFFGGTGSPAVSSLTESWNGSAWTEINDMATARLGMASSIPSSTSALASGGTTSGGTPGKTAATEEFSFPSSPILTEGDIFLSGGTTLKGFGKAAGIPSGVWSSGGAVNNGREGGCWFGSLTAGVAAGGDSPGLYVEHYNGTSWASQSNIPARAVRGSGTGTQTAGVIYGMGHAPSGGSRGDGFSYDGTNWTAIAELNTARNNAASAGGAQTSALCAGGTPPTKSEVEIWDGTSWTEVGDLNDSRYSLVGGGTTTSAVVAGGYGGSPTTNPAQTETWDGSSWTETNNLNTGRAFLTGGGNSSNQVILFGGGPASPGTYTQTEFWNGTSWTEMNDMATRSETSFGTTQGAGAGTYRASGRINGTIQTGTEEWTVEAALSTVTVS